MFMVCESTRPDHEFAELLWENGQIVMQGHSNRSKESSFPTTFPSHAARVQEKEGGRDAGDPKASQFHAMDPMFDGFSPSGPSAHIGANAPQDDDMVPWINYPIDQEPLPDDTLQQNDYCSGFLNEFPGASLNSPPSYNNPMATVRSSGLGQDIRNWHNVEHGHASKAIKESSEPSRVKTSQFFQSSQHCQSSAPNSISRAIDAGISDSTRTHSSQNQNIPTSPRPPQLNGGGVLNFPHFSRPALLAKANLQLRSNEKASALSNSNTVESTLIESASVFKSATGVQGLAASVPPPKMGLQSSVRPRREVISVEQQPEAICRQDALRKNNLDAPTNNNCSNKPPDQLASSSVVASVSVTRRHEAEKAPEAVVASSSSVCSVNSAGAGAGAGAASNDDPKQREKRKSRQGEESGYQSEEDFEFEDGSVELRKPATGRGTSAKSSRAAEVHNLSERRRRDRINEKMRALQELIPNCNKADKASMLEEAIEYLKTLQMQVQIMSMSTGLCVPPMLLPPGMQPMHAPAMVRFSPMGVLGMGMGVGFGYGMGMYDMHGSPPSCSMFPLPPPRLPCPSSSIPIPGPLLGLHGMPGPANRRMFGNPGQGVPLPMPRPSSFGSCSGLSFKANSVPGITAPTANCLIPASDAAAPTSISHDQQQQQNIDLESLHG